jgi:hypothetical protein
LDRSWREVVAALAGSDAGMAESTTDPEWPDHVVAQLSGSDAGWYRLPGRDAQAAWCAVAHAVGDVRLVQSLEGAGWEIVEEVVDETTYVVARDPAGLLWAIGVASSDGDRRANLERDIGFDDRTFGRVAFVEPLDTRSPESVSAALAAFR